MSIYQHTIYHYHDPDAEMFRALFPDQTGDYLIVISGVETLESEGGMWAVIPDSLFVGIWDIWSFVHKKESATGERVFLLRELRAGT
jgi:hypothetical protein